MLPYKIPVCVGEYFQMRYIGRMVAQEKFFGE